MIFVLPKAPFPPIDLEPWRSCCVNSSGTSTTLDFRDLLEVLFLLLAAFFMGEKIKNVGNEFWVVKFSRSTARLVVDLSR